MSTTPMRAANSVENAFRDIRTGELDHQFLRICAVHRLLMRKRAIGKDRAIKLLAQRKVTNAKALTEMWLANPKVEFSQ